MGVRRVFDRASSRSAGFSLPELLAVLALVAIAIAIAIPLVNEQVRIADVRAAADDLAVHLRAARMISVTTHAPIKFTVLVDPDNKFNYPSTDGIQRWYPMPARVRITAASVNKIEFQSNGSVVAAGAIVLESLVSGSTERWTASVSMMGMPTLVHERVN